MFYRLYTSYILRSMIGQLKLWHFEEVKEKEPNCLRGNMASGSSLWKITISGTIKIP